MRTLGIPALVAFVLVFELGACGGNDSTQSSSSSSGSAGSSGGSGASSSTPSGGGSIGSTSGSGTSGGITSGSTASSLSSGSTSGESSSTSSSRGAEDGGGEAGDEGGITGGMVTCAAMDPPGFDVTKIGVMEQLTVAPDGTVYWCSRVASIGIAVPPYSTFNKAWTTVAGSVFGIALDPTSKILYAGARSTTGGDKLYKIPIDNPTAVTSVTLPTMNSINGVTLGSDRYVYFADQVGNNVYRIGATDSTPTKVNTSPIAQPNDLAFGPDGWLYINEWSPAQITRLDLQNGLEVSRDSPWTSFQVTGGPTPSQGDGIAFDSAGNVYAAAHQLYKITPAKQVTVVSMTAGAGIEFGCGTLSCNDLLYSSPAGVSLYNSPIPGFVVPWHLP